jgi:hypothetical protein
MIPAGLSFWGETEKKQFYHPNICVLKFLCWKLTLIWWYWWVGPIRLGEISVFVKEVWESCLLPSTQLERAIYQWILTRHWSWNWLDLGLPAFTIARNKFLLFIVFSHSGLNGLRQACYFLNDKLSPCNCSWSQSYIWYSFPACLTTHSKFLSPSVKFMPQ